MTKLGSFFLVSLLSATSAFTPFMNNEDRSVASSSSSSSSSPLSFATSAAAAATPPSSPLHLDEEKAREVMAKAKAYAYSENDGGDDLKKAKALLRDMITLQSGCVTGTLVGKDLCDSQDEAADIVAHLRTKIQLLEQLEHAKHPHGSPPTTSAVPMVATELALGAMVMVVAVFWTTMDMSLQQGDEFIAPNNIHDWWAGFTQMGYVSFL